jgi:hypothetical protein
LGKILKVGNDVKIMKKNISQKIRKMKKPHLWWGSSIEVGCEKEEYY